MKIDKSDKVVTERLDRVTCFVVKYLCEQGITISTAESCTGGLLSSAITSVPGSSKIFWLGVCSYSERAKVEYLGVDGSIIKKYGVYSEQTASAMAQAIKKKSGSFIGVGITGIAGPLPDEDGKRAGTVYVAVTDGVKEIVKNLALYDGSITPTRENIRKESVTRALCMVMELVGHDMKEVIGNVYDE